MLNNIFFVASLPRSGSTLLMNLLGQNPNHHVTPTSGLIELFLIVKGSWTNCIEFKAQGLGEVKPRVLGSLRGIIRGHFEDELNENKVVFDKSRGWFQFIENIEEAFGTQIKVIATVRDVRDILASFEKLYRKRGIEHMYPGVGDGFFKCQTIEGRCDYLLGEGGMVGLTINRLRDAIMRGVRDRLVIIPYQTLTKDPTGTLKSLHEVLKLEPYEYNADNVQQITHEDDMIHGLDLHVIKPKVVPGEKETWKGIIPTPYAEMIADKFKDINELAALGT